MELLVFFVVFAVINSTVGYLIGAGKGRGSAGFWWGFWLGWVGWIVIAFLPPSPEEQGRRDAIRERARLRSRSYPGMAAAAAEQWADWAAERRAA